MLALTAIIALCLATWATLRVRTAMLRSEVLSPLSHCNPGVAWDGVEPTEIYFHNLAGPQPLNDSDMKEVAALKSLVVLRIRGAPSVTDEGMRQITGLSNLHGLSIEDVPITDAGLAHIAQLTNLRTLILQDTRVTDRGLVHLRSLQRLLCLQIQDCPGVTDEGLEHLHELKNLQVVVLNGCHVTLEGVQRLRDALPNADISPSTARLGRNGDGSEWH